MPFVAHADIDHETDAVRAGVFDQAVRGRRGQPKSVEIRENLDRLDRMVVAISIEQVPPASQPGIDDRDRNQSRFVAKGLEEALVSVVGLGIEDRGQV